MKEIISTQKAPAAIGPYSQAVGTGNLVFCSGQVPLVPETGTLIEGGIKEQTQQVFKNIEAILAQASLTMADIVKTTVFLTDINDFADMNEVYAEYFEGNYPARSAVQVAALPKGAKIEIEVICAKE